MGEDEGREPGISLDRHTLQRAEERGTTEDEVRDVLRRRFPIEAKGCRRGRAKVYPFDRERNGKYYEEKRVEVIYTVENDSILTVTVYVFYGKWEDPR